MIDFDNFLEWCESRFPETIVKGKEIKINSIFTDDNKQHLSCNVNGGKYHREDGCYRCFYTDKKGTLIGLVMLVDNCSYEEAKDILSGKTPLRDLEEKLEKFFATEEKKEEIPESKIKLPLNTYLISSLSDYTRKRAEEYLMSRKIPIDGLYVCTNGDYKNRIIIPYYDSTGKLIYFNGRNLGNGLRYLGPDKSLGTGKGDVIFALKWPSNESKIYLTEGEFDAMSLSISGLNGMACGGKYLSENQIQMIKCYEICLALDGDKSGLNAIIEMGKRLNSNQVSKVTYIRPPKGIKDWNKMLILFKPEIIVKWIKHNEKKFDDFSNLTLAF